MARWNLRELNELPSGFATNTHPLIAKLLYSKGFQTEEGLQSFVAPNYEKDVLDPFLFRDMKKAVERIQRARDQREKVVIFGDYDADGVTSSAILKETLDKLGIESEVYIPDKRTEGYGMNMAAIDSFKEKVLSLIITVDCGITNIKEVARAKEHGIDVIITDHHHVPEEVPEAFAIINPHQKDCGYPFADLAGVGVAFKLVQALFQRLLEKDKEQTRWMLDLVAIGTVADCVDLVGENRIFVKYGLIVLSKTRRMGLHELFTVGRMMIDETNVPDTKKISFYIAPRINAAGRINHANLAYDLIMSDNVAKARELALELEASNIQRQKITEQIVSEVRVLANNSFKDKKFIFATSEHFSIGIVGLVAGKIAQEFNKPTAIIQKGETESKGSFRSIPKINIIETIGQCSDLLLKYGGHSQAAGISVENAKTEAFYEKMNALIEQQLDGVELVEEINIDAELLPADVDFALTDSLEKLKPFGEGNGEPIFLMRNLIVRERKIIGSTNKHVKMFLSVKDGNPKIFEAISFNGAERFASILENDCIDIVCTVAKDEWNGSKKIQLTLLDAKHFGE
ncbi:MAG TPA: single-stranded-DNA-specific exonuclease RecJ [Patescibacteria group bacterium]